MVLALRRTHLQYNGRISELSFDLFPMCPLLYKVKKPMCLSITPWKHMGSGSAAPRILSLDVKWRWAVQFHVLRQSQSGYFGIKCPRRISYYGSWAFYPLHYSTFFRVIASHRAVNHSLAPRKITLWGITYVHMRRKCQCGLVWRKRHHAGNWKDNVWPDKTDKDGI